MSIIFFKPLFELHVVAHTCNLSTQEAETGGLWIHSHPVLDIKTLSQKQISKQQQNII
jgi:hypothetical protein